MSNPISQTVSVVSDAILSVQPCERCEVAELRWDGASENIRGKHPERATMTQ